MGRTGRLRHRGDSDDEDGDRAVYQITGARRSVSADVDARTRRYLISMGIRTVCFVLAIIAGGWLRWVFIVGALVLPYVAVVIANAGREPNRADPLFAKKSPRALGAVHERPPTINLDGHPSDADQPRGGAGRAGPGERPPTQAAQAHHPGGLA
jgi:Protein of unknown function (DUF3099)